AAVAERDDRLLEGATELGGDERVEPAPQAVVRDPHRSAESAEPRRGRVEELAGRVEAPRQRAPQRRKAVELAAELAEERPAVVGEGRRKAGRRVERVAD